MRPFRPRFKRKRDHFYKYEAPVRATDKEMVRYRSCGHKIRHATHEQAKDHASRVIPRPGRVMSAYRCRFCRFWHVGNEKKRP